MRALAEFFLYESAGTWHAKAIKSPCSGYKQKTGVLRHFTSTKRAEALQMFNRWRAFFADGAGFETDKKKCLQN
jgi:hypothetical protein